MKLKTLLLLTIFLFSKFTYTQNKTVETTGDIFLYVLPAVTLGATLLKKDKMGTKQFAKSFILNQVVTFSLKAITNHPRPDLSNNNAFPSGHTSTTFQSASFIQQRYGWKYGIPAYAIAGFTAYSRIEAKKHDGWDIAAGIIIGVGSTYLFTTPYEKEHFELTYMSNNNNYLVGVKFKF